jgi:hypothetical protein
MRRLPAVSALSALAALLLALPLALPSGARAAATGPGSAAGAGPVKQPVAVGSGGAVASMDTTRARPASTC